MRDYLRRGSLVLCSLGWATATSLAGSPDGRYCPTPRGRDYQPTTNRYVIVQPTPLPAVASRGARPCNWPLTQVQAQPYPYGWFGARAAVQPSRRGSFYGDTIDYQWQSAP